MRTYVGNITDLKPHQIFVFGSNTQGRHGKGAAKTARELFGAKYGQASGLQGQSYAIITKDLTLPYTLQYKSISENDIKKQIEELYSFAKEHPDKEFFIAYTGNGVNLNGYSSKEMATMFSSFEIPNNIVFEIEFAKLL